MQDFVSISPKNAEIKSKPNLTTVYPTNLSSLFFKIKDYLDSHSNCAIFFEGLEYLTTQNSFKQVLNLIQYIGDFIAARNIEFIASYDSKAFEQIESSLLKNEIQRFGQLFDEEYPSESLNVLKRYVNEGKEVFCLVRSTRLARDVYPLLKFPSMLGVLTTNTTLENYF